MNERTRSEEGAFMDWLDDVVDADPEARLAAREEEVQLHLARALRLARESVGMTQATVAEASGLRQSMVSRLEKADHNPTLQTVLKYLNAVGAELVVSLLVGDGAFPATEAADRSVTVPCHVARQAASSGLTLREHVLTCIAKQETRSEMAALFRDECRRQMSEMRSWVQAEEDGRRRRPDAGAYVASAGDARSKYPVAA